jgi:ubiquitin
MLPPYKSLDFKLLSDEAIKKIADFVLAKPEVIQSHVSTVTGKYDGISYPKPQALTAILGLIRAEYKIIRESCTLPFEPSLIYCKPGTVVQRHADGKKSTRMCTIITPIHPLTEYAPTMFWQSWNARSPRAVLTIDKLPALVNIQELHSLTNGSEPRFNFQLGFGEPYEVVLDLLQRGELFKKLGERASPLVSELN